LREAELGLVLARAGGGRQVAVAGHRRVTGSQVGLAPTGS
jgi:hypothetical protein